MRCWSLTLAVLFALAAATPAAAQCTFATLSPGTWCAVTSSDLDAVKPTISNSGLSINGVLAYSGGAYDSSRKVFIIWGGGHNDYAGNEIYMFDVDPESGGYLTWTRTDPTDPVDSTDGPATYNVDGRPRSNHTYNNLEYIPAYDKFCSIGITGQYSQGNGAYRQIWCNDFDNQTPTMLGWAEVTATGWTTAQNQIAYESNAVLDPTTGNIYYARVLNDWQDLFVLDTSTNTWDPLTNYGTNKLSPGENAYQAQCAIHDTERIMYCVGGGSMWSWGLTGSNTFTNLTGTVSGSTVILNADDPGIEYDSTNDQIIAYAGTAGSLDKTYILEGNSWTEIDVDVSNVDVPGAMAPNGTFGRWQYIPSENAFVLYSTNASSDVFLYRLPVDNGGAAQTDLGLGTLAFDRANTHTISIDLPLACGTCEGATGIPAYTTTATVEYRATADAVWIDALPLMRVRPDWGNDANRNEGFAGMIWGLEPGTSYDVRITVTEPAVGFEVVEGTTTTRALQTDTTGTAASEPCPAHPACTIAPGTSSAAVQTILDEAVGGDIIEFAAGQHDVTGLIVNITAGSRTFSEPLTIRGEGRGVTFVGDSTVADNLFDIRSDHVIIENMTIREVLRTSGDYAIRIDGRPSGGAGYEAVEDVTIRNCVIENRRAIRAWEGTATEVYDVTIYNNTFAGIWSWAEIVDLKNNDTAHPDCIGGRTGHQCTWDDTPFKSTGQGLSFFNNTIYGYGDSYKISAETAIPTVHVAIHDNDILWGGDDGIEMDAVHHGAIAYNNRIANTATCGSLQPTDTLKSGGPGYYVNNVCVNQWQQPWKLNDGYNGVRIINNTTVATENYGWTGGGESRQYLWKQDNTGRIENIQCLNNLNLATQSSWDPSVGADQLLRFDADMIGEEWDYNAYWAYGNQDGAFEFRLFSAEATFAAAQSGITADGYGGAGFEAGGQLLTAQPLAAGVSMLGLTWETQVEDFDARLAVGGAAIGGGIGAGGYEDDQGAIQYVDALPAYGDPSYAAEPPPSPNYLAAGVTLSGVN